MKQQNKYLEEMNDKCCGRPCLTMYHANAKGTGSALKAIMHPADREKDGYLEIRIANQISVGDLRATIPTYPKFYWDNYREVYLDFDAVCKLLQVFRGECESVNDGRGIYIQRDDGAKINVNLAHLIDPVCGYQFRMQYRSGDTDNIYRFFFTCSEALGMCEAIAGSLYLMAFGKPSVMSAN